MFVQMPQGWGPGIDRQAALPPQVPGLTPHGAPPLCSATAAAFAAAATISTINLDPGALR